jgi:hypothetical protein
LLGAAVAAKVPARQTFLNSERIEFSLETPALIDNTRLPQSLSDAGITANLQPTPPRLGGLRSAQNIDSAERGERGDNRSLEQGRLLAHRSESVNLSQELQNTLSAEQVQRLRTSRHRASWQNDRRTPNEGDQAWVSLSHGELLFRVAPASTRPTQGAQTAAARAAVVGEQRANVPDFARGNTRPEQLSQRPQAQGAPLRLTAGVLQAQGNAARAAGQAALMQPNVQHGHASTTSENTFERPQDDVDTAALATSLARSVLNATVHDGAQLAAGVGGVGGGGRAGSGGGVGEGGRARAFGEGEGILSLSSPDGRYRRYFLQLRRRLGQLTRGALPEEDALALRQGTMIVNLRVDTDGTIHVERFARHSGLSGFDQNVQRAVDGATGPAIPANVSSTALRVSYELTALNPMVR